jgi:hypothetical protein
MIPRPYTPAEDAAIRSKNAPDAILAMQWGRTTAAINNRRKRLRERPAVYEPPEAQAVTEEERLAVLREEVEALRWRVEEAERTLAKLTYTLACKERELRAKE